MTTKKGPVASADADEEEAAEQSGEDDPSQQSSERDSTSAAAADGAKSDRPDHWKKVRKERQGPKKRAWSKSKAKKIRKQHKREQKAKKRH